MGILQKIISASNAANIKPTGNPATPAGQGAASEPTTRRPNARCPVCLPPYGRHFWQDTYGVWWCTQCRPPAAVAMVRDQVLAGLYANFILMDQASIKTTIPVSASVPAKFNLPLETETTVILSQDVTIRGARVSLNTGGLTINNAPTDIVLPKGTRLPILLSLKVPVDQKIPVDLNVTVDIPLNQTELHTPFVGLQNVVAPYYHMLNSLPDSWSQIVCGNPPEPLCLQFIP